MKVGPPPYIALTRNSCQPVEATTCSRQIALLDLQPRCLHNPFGLQYSVTAFENVWLAFLQDSLSIL
jgi:hypothetical protein